jgi:hypothetical protein
MNRRTGFSRAKLLIAQVIFTAPLTVATLPAAAQDDVEKEIEAELQRQEEMLRPKAPDPQTERAFEAPLTDEASLAERANPRIAPKSPADRKLPLAIFVSEDIEIPDPSSGGSATLSVIKRSLDADRDGTPEQIRYFDKSSGEIIRKVADRDFDGTIDAWQTYSGGLVVERKLDENNDSRVDVWERYRDGRMIERIIDRDSNGREDAFYKYSDGSLIEEHHDRNDDGNIDLIVEYQDRRKISSREDRNKDGKFDTWTSYAVVGNKEIPAQIERDSNASGKVDIVETFDTSSGEPILAKREEDKNNDGKMDVTSIYRNGKLHRREIADPDLAPM